MKTQNAVDITKYNDFYKYEGSLFKLNNSHDNFKKVVWKNNIIFSIKILPDTFAYGDCILYKLIDNLQINLNIVELYFNNLSEDEIFNKIKDLNYTKISDNKISYDNFIIDITPNYKVSDYFENNIIDCTSVIYDGDQVFGNSNFIRTMISNTLMYDPKCDISNYKKYMRLGFLLFVKNGHEKYIYPNLCKYNDILLKINCKLDKNITINDNDINNINKIWKSIFKYGNEEMAEELLKKNLQYNSENIKLSVLFNNYNFFVYIINRDGYMKFTKILSNWSNKKGIEWLKKININCNDIQYNFVNAYSKVIRDQIKKYNDVKIFNERQFYNYCHLKEITDNLNNFDNLKNNIDIETLTIPNINTIKYVYNIKNSKINDSIFDILDIIFLEKTIRVVYENFSVEYENITTNVINYCVQNNLFDITKYTDDFKIVHPSWIDKLNNLNFICILETLFKHTDIEKIDEIYKKRKLDFLLNLNKINEIIAVNDYVYILYYFMNNTEIKICDDVMYYIKNKSIKCVKLLGNAELINIIKYGLPEMINDNVNLDELILLLFESVKYKNSETFNYLYNICVKNDYVKKLNNYYDENNYTIYHYVCLNNINTDVTITETENCDGVTPSDLLNINQNYNFGDFITYDV